MSIAALNWAFSLDTVTQAQKMVLLSMANFADENGHCFPSMATMARLSCCSEATVRRCIADLEAAGLLRKEARFRPDGSQTSSGYTLAIGGCTMQAPPVTMTPPPCTAVTPPPVTGDTPKNRQLTTIEDTDVSSKILSPAPDDRLSMANEAGDLWQDMASRTGLPRFRGKLDADRRKRLMAVLADGGLDRWRAVLERIERSHFLTTTHTPGIDWVLKPANLRKIEEGNYDNRTKPAQPTARLDRFGGTSATDHLRRRHGVAGSGAVADFGSRPGDLDLTAS